MPKLALNGFSMYYETYGSGQPLVFIPGALGTGRTDFEHQISWFSQNHQVIAVDPRGYGESRPPERDYPLGFYQRDAEDVLALMTALGYRVARNAPYAGGYTTEHYGRPGRKVHALQIELSRALYFDETALKPTAGMVRLKADLARLFAALAAHDWSGL